MLDPVEELECPVCKNEFDDERQPVLLGCGHSLCRECSQGLSRGYGRLECPVCRTETAVPAGGLPVNYLASHYQDHLTRFRAQHLDKLAASQAEVARLRDQLARLPGPSQAHPPASSPAAQGPAMPHASSTTASSLAAPADSATPALPQPVSGHSLKRGILILGGWDLYHPSEQAEFYSLEPETPSRLFACSPVALHAACLLNDHILQTGGTVGFGAINFCQLLRLEDLRRAREPSAHLPQPLLAHGCVAGSDGSAYVVGGQTAQGEASAEVLRYRSRRWESLPSMLEARSYFGLAADGQSLCAFGGLQGNSRDLFSAERFDFGYGRWKGLPSLPEPRSHCQAVFAGGRFHVLGGLASEGHLSLDLRSGRWEPGRAGLLHPHLCGHSAVTVDNKIFVLGGCPESSNKVVEMYDPRADAWSVQRPLELSAEYSAAVALP